MPKAKENDKTKAVVKHDETALKKVEEPQAVETRPMTITEKMVSMIPSVGTAEFTKKQQEIIYAPIDEADIEIRPDGLVYLPWVFYKERLTKAFKGQAVMIPATPLPAMENNLILWGFWLVINGKPSGFAIGQQEYKASNPVMTYGDAIEGAKSNAGMRLCKDIGIGLELWKPQFVREWQKKYAEKNTYPQGNRQVTRWKRKGIKPTVTVEAEVRDNGPEDDLLTSKGDTEKIAIELAEQITNDLEKLHKVDVKEFKKWLVDYQLQCEPPREYIDKLFGNLSFRAGDVDDLKSLHSQLGKAVEKYKKSLEPEEPEEPEEGEQQVFS